MFWCSNRRVGSNCSGQASVEAAMIIPLLLTGMLIALQPAIVLYDRLVMEAAASEGCRVIETLPSADADVAREYVERRLAAIPGISVFHSGDWNVEVAGAGQQGECVSVRISHELEPLPLIGAGMGMVGLAGSDGMFRQEVFRETSQHDIWALRSEFGLDFQVWVQRWDEKA